MQLSLSLVKCNTEFSLLVRIESKFSTFFILKNVRKIKKTLKNVENATRIKNVKKLFLDLWYALDMCAPQALHSVHISLLGSEALEQGVPQTPCNFYAGYLTLAP